MSEICNIHSEASLNTIRDENLVSIIVPIYNVEKYVDACVQSLVLQSYQQIEILLVDDGSTDRSGEICANWAKKDSRIKVFHKENGGLSDARNYGIERAQGAYLSFVDGDDYVCPDFIEYLFKNRVKGGVAICGYTLKWPTSQIEVKLKKGMYTSKEAISEYLSNEIRASNGGLPGFGSFAWNKLWYYSLFESIRYPVGKKWEDVWIIFSLFYQATFIHVLNNAKYMYIQRANSISNAMKSIGLDFLEGRYQQKKQLQQYYPGNDQYQKWIDVLIFATYCALGKQWAYLSSEMKYKNKNLLEKYRQCRNELKQENVDIPVKIKLKADFYFKYPLIARLLFYIRAVFLGR